MNITKWIFRFNKLHKVDTSVSHDTISQEWKKWDDHLKKLSQMQKAKTDYESNKPYQGKYDKQTILQMYKKYSSSNLENNEAMLSTEKMQDKNIATNKNKNKNTKLNDSDIKENEEQKLKIQEQFFQWCQKNYGIMDRAQFMEMYPILFLTDDQISKLKEEEKQTAQKRTEKGKKAKYVKLSIH